MLQKTFILPLVLLLVACSCKESKKSEAEKIVNTWTGKEIIFPGDIPCNILSRDTVCPDLSSWRYKVLLYVDSMGCGACKLKQLQEWKTLIQASDSLFNGQLGFFLYFHPKDRKELNYLVKLHRFNYPVFFDEKNSLNNLNHFPEDPSYQCFLLDADNKVLIIGNPAVNTKILDLYKQQITGEISSPAEKNLTFVEISEAVKDFGTVRVKSKNKAVFELRNTGDCPLVINRVLTSCGCTVAEWEKSPVLVGKTTEIKVEMQPETAGYFRKTIEVFCNVGESPLQLQVSGTAQ